MSTPPLSFVVASNDRSILEANLLASPCLKDGQHQILVQEGFDSAARAYNAAMEHCANETVVFIHQDVFLPAEWVGQLSAALTPLERTDPQWGVAGCWGITETGEKVGYLYTPGDGVIGHASKSPVRVRVLDELVLVMRKGSGLRFSEEIPGFHFYGVDICLTAARAGRNCYAISAFCVHNSRQYFGYPADFNVSYRRMKSKWRSELPIQTSCICISRFDRDLWKRRIKRTLAWARGRSLERGPRLEDPSAVPARFGVRSQS